MLLAKSSDLVWQYSEQHDIDVGFSDSLPSNQSADVIFARIRSGHTLSVHYHIRPLDADGSDKGYESFFFFNGANIVLITQDGEVSYELSEPFTLTFFSHEKEMHGIRNVADEDVVFQVLCAPRFDENEERFVDHISPPE
jgi:hypothetical protein